MKNVLHILTLIIISSLCFCVSCAQSGESSDTNESGLSCRVSITCATVFDNRDKLTSGKDEIIPEDGFILHETEVALSGGESAFDVLLKTTRDLGIHMEHSKTPVYKSSYIEGINNLYEFDCGELSGWTYKVNGLVPDHGCSQQILAPGDAVEILYTCDLGADVGGVLYQ